MCVSVCHYLKHKPVFSFPSSLSCPAADQIGAFTSIWPLHRKHRASPLTLIHPSSSILQPQAHTLTHSCTLCSGLDLQCLSVGSFLFPLLLCVCQVLHQCIPGQCCTCQLCPWPPLNSHSTRDLFQPPAFSAHCLKLCSRHCPLCWQLQNKCVCFLVETLMGVVGSNKEE